ncbi:MAG: hypothetical protein KDE20_25805, partial [Caldilineaceae bacterium]|nr:hypothetical protein [Caldilineaceae bacterium]
MDQLTIFLQVVKQFHRKQWMPATVSEQFLTEAFVQTVGDGCQQRVDKCAPSGLDDIVKADFRLAVDTTEFVTDVRQR